MPRLNKDKEGRVLLKVIDEGEGFKENETEKIFERFYSNRPEKFGQHSGLGLNIVKNLVELHNAKIYASNNKDRGAKVEIIFPEKKSQGDDKGDKKETGDVKVDAILNDVP